jgi:hypothetical protein
MAGKQEGGSWSESLKRRGNWEDLNINVTGLIWLRAGIAAAICGAGNESWSSMTGREFLG